jgi:hypothetical protein
VKGFKMNKVLVISIAKTGSTTVMNALRSANVIVGRAHSANYQDINPRDYTHFVTMMREPVERGIAEWFEVHRAQVLADEDYVLGSVFRTFEERIVKPLAFYEKYVQDYIGVNVYGMPFVKVKGYRVYSKKLLAIRTNRLSDQLAVGLAELLGMQPEDFTVEHRAQGEERFGEVYTEFLKNVKFDRAFLEELYDSRHCKHFFYAKKIRELISKWSRSPR